MKQFDSITDLSFFNLHGKFYLIYSSIEEILYNKNHLLRENIYHYISVKYRTTTQKFNWHPISV